MRKEEKFKIWDATSPDVSEVREYLDRLCGTTPLPLVFKAEDGKFLYDNQIHNLPFVGILIEDTIFYARGFSNRDRYDKNSCSLLYRDLSVGDIENWIKQNIDTFASDAHPVYEQDAVLLHKHRDKLLQTIKILDYHRISGKDMRLPKLHDTLIPWVKKNPSSISVYHLDGMTRTSFFLEVFGDLWVCSKKS